MSQINKMPYLPSSKKFYLFVNKDQKLISNGNFQKGIGEGARIYTLKTFPENKDYVIATVVNKNNEIYHYIADKL